MLCLHCQGTGATLTTDTYRPTVVPCWHCVGLGYRI